MDEILILSQTALIGASAALGWLGARTYLGHEKPVERSFSVLLALLGMTAFCIGVTGATGTVNKLVWLTTNLSIPLALLAFSFNYYGIALFSSRARTAAVFGPAVLGLVGGVVLIVGTPAKTAGTMAPVEAVATLPGIVFEIAGTFNTVGYYYTAGVVLFAVGLVGVNVFRYEHLDTRLAASVAFIGAWPWLGNFVLPDLGGAFGGNVGLAVLALGYLTSAVVAGLIIGPLELFASSPAAGNVGPKRVLDSIDDAVVITDDHGQVLRLNAVACELFGVGETAAVGQSMAAVVGRQAEELDGNTTTELETVSGIRQFAVTRSAVTDETDFERGTVFVLRDVTQRETREQRLEVLNRVLRHNLRNNATSIIGRAQLISEGNGDEESAKQIIETTRNLVGVAESARDIENMMAATGSNEVTAVGLVIDKVVGELQREHPAVEVTTAVPSDATAAVSERAFETVLSQLVENAAEHNDAEEPIVVISADRTDDNSLMIAISDNGPGIPEHERAVLDAGQEDQLQHGSGLGLWAVHWGITQMGGTLSIADNDPRGTTVSVTIPAAAETTVTSRENEEAELTV